ncbi:MAG: FMN-binding protein [Coriobacteriia bacterium]
MNSALKLILPVLVTCVVAATGLSLTYTLTAPKIAEQDRLAEERSLKAVLPEADAFGCIEDSSVIEQAQAAADPVRVVDVFRATADDEPIGWAVKISSRGYGGPIILVVGLDTSGSTTGVSILTMNETPGLGTKVQTEPWFLEQFIGLPGGYTDADVRALDAISGSTRSSNGIRNGVAAAGRVHAEVLSGMEGGSE